MGITIEKQGARVYLLGDTFAHKDAIKGIGGHWDGERRAWWVGAKKEQAARDLVARVCPVSAAAAGVGLRGDTPAGIVADRLEDEGRDQEATAVREAAQSPKPVEDVSKCRVYAQVEYKGRRYYVIAETRDLTRCRLTTLDGLTPFWVDCADCNLVKRYEGREVWDGRRYSGRTVTRYSTIGSLREFRDRQKNPETARHQCMECGSWCNAGEPCRDCGGC